MTTCRILRTQYQLNVFHRRASTVPCPFRRLLSTNPQSTHDPLPLTAEIQKFQKQSFRERHKSRSKSNLKSYFDVECPWEVVCGLEVHAQLNTERKLFSDARTSTVASPNTHISPIDASLPGTQPNFNPAILLPALRAALALSCTPSAFSRFDRKHYFYWDQPAGYQITQFYHPLARHGSLTLDPATTAGISSSLRIGIRQVQIEQDTGKTIVSPPFNLVDLNRVGAPLVEIITDPFPLSSADTAAHVLSKIQAVLRAVDACVVGMEWGGLRADVNVSVRRRGAIDLGQRCEIKNLSSFKAVSDAVLCEAHRQILILEEGGTVEGETRGWDAEMSETTRLRGKEGEVDYRYMPEPDLPLVVLAPDLITRVRETMPLLPDQIVAGLTGPKYGLTAKDANTLLQWDDGRSDHPNSVVTYYKTIVDLLSPRRNPGKVAGNWVIHELGGILSSREGLSWANNPVDAPRLAELIGLVLDGKISGQTAKTLLPVLISDARTPGVIVDAERLGITVMSDEELMAIIKAVLETDEGRNVVGQISSSALAEKKVLKLKGFVAGKVMRELKGKVAPQRVHEVLDKILAK